MGASKANQARSRLRRVTDPPMPSKVTTIRLTPHELWQLRRLAEDTGLPIATLIRDAVSVYVETAIVVTSDSRSICITPPSARP